MGRQILEIAQEAAERDATAPAPAKLFGTNDRIARILRMAAKDTMREYLRSTNFVGLSEFQSTWVFTLTPGRFAYPLPPDFLRLIPGTEHRNGWPLGLIGPSSPQTWAAWLHGGSAVASPMGWRIRNGALWIEPTPSAAELVAIEYISRYPVVSLVQDGDFDLTTSPLQTNAPVVSRDGYLSMPDASLLEAPEADDALYGDDETGYDEGTYGAEPEEVLKRLHPLSAVDPLPQVRRPEFTADTDEPAFDDDYLLSLGMTFRLRRGLGLPYAEHAAEYEEEMQVKAATDAGAGESISMGRCADGFETYPLGNSRWMVS